MRRVVSSFCVAVATLTSPVADADPPSRASGSLRSAPPRLELKLPFLAPLRFSFSSDPVPGFEALRLGTYRAESVWFEAGKLSLRTFGHVAPTLELDCALGCRPMLERVAGVELQLGLGGLGRTVPASYLFLRGQSAHAGPLLTGAKAVQKSGLLSLGIGGLLDF